MDAIRLETQEDRFVISIGRDYLDKDTITRLIERIKLKPLVIKADFDGSVEDMGEKFCLTRHYHPYLPPVLGR